MIPHRTLLLVASMTLACASPQARPAAAAPAPAPAPLVTSCQDICRGQGEGTCCFEKCVCDTDPDPAARAEHCGKWRELGCDRPASTGAP